jgi:hypothetical protein
MLLVIAAVAVLVSAWQLLGLPHSGFPTPQAAVAPPAVVGQARVVASTIPLPSAPFGMRASLVAGQFAAGAIFTLPLLAVILVTFAGGLIDRARLVVQGAVAIQAVALGLGVLGWLGALDAHVRPGVWFIFVAADLAAVAAVLVFNIAVLQSQALRPVTPDLTDFDQDDED